MRVAISPGAGKVGYDAVKRSKPPAQASQEKAIAAASPPLTEDDELRAKDNWNEMRRLMPELCAFMVEMAKHPNFDGRRVLANATIRSRNEGQANAG